MPTHVLLKTVCTYDPSRIASLAARFSLPVFAGKTLRTEIWLDGGTVSFRCRVVERDLVVLNNGKATLQPAMDRL
jgi:acyl dehydratase